MPSGIINCGAVSHNALFARWAQSVVEVEDFAERYTCARTVRVSYIDEKLDTK